MAPTGAPNLLDARGRTIRCKGVLPTSPVSTRQWKPTGRVSRSGLESPVKSVPPPPALLPRPHLRASPVQDSASRRPASQTNRHPRRGVAPTRCPSPRRPPSPSPARVRTRRTGGEERGTHRGPRILLSSSKEVSPNCTVLVPTSLTRPSHRDVPSHWSPEARVPRHEVREERDHRLPH
jgi:hypothetical protein